MVQAPYGKNQSEPHPKTKDLTMKINEPATPPPGGELRDPTLDGLDAIAGAKDNSWVVSIFGGVFFVEVDDGQGPSYGFACVRSGKTTYCVVLEDAAVERRKAGVPRGTGLQSKRIRRS